MSYYRNPLSRSLPSLGRLLLLGLMTATLVGPTAARAQGELNYAEYRALARAADRIDNIAKFEPIHGEEGMFLAIADRFGTVQVTKMDGQGVQRVWKSVQLSGVPHEVLAGDLDGDGLDDSLICRTSNGKIYVWALDGYSLLWESLPSEYQRVTCFTIANIDEDRFNEIVMLADNRIVYIDGESFTKSFTSINEYEATMILCGDVDGDRRVEIVLNSGQVLDSITGDLEWEDERFSGKIELLDIDGDGMPEVLTENPVNGPLKVFDVDHRSEVRFQ